ncbi:hypothetical protein MHU86_14702 [Fragilaria crotonensis]|nr:hypothetical protein MHU86_14702 [Fragilaria crotonensis]
MMNPNPPHDRALIGAKRKTSSSRTAVLNLGQSQGFILWELPQRVGEVSGGTVVALVAMMFTTILAGKRCGYAYCKCWGGEARTATTEHQGKKRRARKKRIRAARSGNNLESQCNDSDGYTPDVENVDKKKPKEDSSIENANKLPDRSPREFLPSQEQMLALLVKGLAFVPGSPDEILFRKTFHLDVENDCRYPGDVKLCGTPMSFILNSLNTVYQHDYDVLQLSSISDMFTEHDANAGTSVDFVQKVYLMDVILNRSMSPSSSPAPLAGEGVLVDPDIVAVMRCFEDDDLMDSVDFKFRTCLAFIPDAGIFYCARERHHPDSGVDNTLIPLDMSWLRLHHCHDCNGSGVYTFGDGYVKKLFMDDGQLVSIWRIGLRSTCHNGHARKTYRAQQCSDRMGPKMAPDVFSGEDAGTWPQAELAALYNCKLASATSAREGRHYALGCHHFNMPPTCWILDPTCDPIIDVIIAIDDEGNCKDQQTVLRIRHVKPSSQGLEDG